MSDPANSIPVETRPIIEEAEKALLQQQSAIQQNSLKGSFPLTTSTGSIGNFLNQLLTTEQSTSNINTIGLGGLGSTNKLASTSSISMLSNSNNDSISNGLSQNSIGTTNTSTSPVLNNSNSNANSNTMSTANSGTTAIAANETGTISSSIDQGVDNQGQIISMKREGERENFVDITEFLNLPQTDAAKRLGIPTSTLSKRWKEAVVNRKWPYRSVAKLDKEIMTLLHNIPQGPDAPPLPPEIEASLGVLLRKRQDELRPVVIRL